MIEIKKLGKNIFRGLTQENLVGTFLGGSGVFYPDGSWEGWQEAPGLGTNTWATYWGRFYLVGGKIYVFSFDVQQLQPSKYTSSFNWISYVSLLTYKEYYIVSSGAHNWTGHYDIEFTAAQTGWYKLKIDMWRSHARFWNVGIFEKDDYVEFEKYREQKTLLDNEMFGFNGVYDVIEGDCVKKFWQRTVKTTDASGNFTLSGYASGSKVIVVNNSNGETKTYDAASTITTPWANAEVTVIYCQSSPTLIELPEHGLKTDDDVNYFDIVSSVKDTYVGDGTTTTFTLSQTADSSYYQVYVNGEVDNSVSRTTTQFTFSEPPKNGALIEVYYNRYYLPTPMSVEMLEPSGTVEQLTFFTNLSINIQQNVRQARDVFGDVEVKKLNETYQVRLDRNILENIDDFYQRYKDKTFRLKIENSSTGEIEYLTPCKIVNANKDYFGRVESITIMALDYYKA